MNRLWVRISLVFSVVIVAVLLLMVTARMVLSLTPLDIADGDSPWESEEASEGDLQPGVGYRLVGALFGAAAVVGVIGLIAGIWISRSLTAPLNYLEEAAQAIGRHDLSYRVPVGGTQELAQVARAFNQMAADLERGEELRRNLVADVAHELRTPLTVLLGNLRAILDDVYRMDKKEMAQLYDQTRHLIRLVNDLHELAQAEARQLPLDLQPTDLAQLVQSAAVLFAPMAEAQSVSLQTELADDLPLIQADPARLTQVLHNLLSNALRHTPAGGRITVSAGTVPGYVAISVADTGEGIAPENLARVFDRFYRTDRARSRDTGGAGLGLAIVRAMVELHGGWVSVTSERIGRGSVFTIQLPL